MENNDKAGFLFFLLKILEKTFKINKAQKGVFLILKEQFNRWARLAR